MADSVFTAFLDSAVRTATPLALAGLGEAMCERTGVINLGMEGAIIAGALGAAAGAAAGDVTLGLLGGVIAGFITAVVFSVFAVWLRTDQIITGTAVTLGALGITSALYRILFGIDGAALSLPMLESLPIPGLSQVPIIGRALFQQPITSYVAFLLAPVCAWFLFHTRPGLVWRATGESPAAVTASGHQPRRIQLLGVLCGGSLGGLAGCALVLSQVGTFADGMSAGRGFIAVAVVALGRWNPYGVLAASFLFGASTALQYLFQAAGTSLPYQAFLAVPYLLALAVLAVGAGRGTSPVALGRRSLDDGPNN